nr:MAG TPA: hypothetical protein [Caudoviricetes sp.]
MIYIFFEFKVRRRVACEGSTSLFLPHSNVIS